MLHSGLGALFKAFVHDNPWDDAGYAGSSGSRPCLATQLRPRDWLELAWCLLDTVPVGSDLSPVLQLTTSAEAQGAKPGSSSSNSVYPGAAEPVTSDVWWLAILSALARPAKAGDEWRARADWLYDTWLTVAGGTGRMYRSVYGVCVRMVSGAADAAARLGWLRHHGLGPEEVALVSSSSSSSSNGAWPQ